MAQPDTAKVASGRGSPGEALMIVRTSALAAAWIALAAGFGSTAARAQDAAPLEVYGALPAMEFV